MRGLAGASFASLFGLLICAVPTVVGAWYAVRPSERLLSMMRPLTLAAIFAALCSFVLALTNGAMAMTMIRSVDVEGVHHVGAVLMEGLAPVAASLACLTVAWGCVAIGMRRG